MSDGTNNQGSPLLPFPLQDTGQTAQAGGLLPYQRRVVAERVALEQKIIDLSFFIDKDRLYNELSPIDRVLLQQQLLHMQAYSDILTRRIERFT